MTTQSTRLKSQPLPAEDVLLRRDDGPIAILTLNRPDARNSLSEGLITALQTELDQIAAEKDIRAVVIAANGSAFSAGHDLKELTARRSDADGGRAYFAQIMTMCSTMMQTVVRLPKPVIASVQGIASAAGCQLVASCDLAVASDAATFATPGVDIGLFCSTPMVALSRNISRKHAMGMLLTGEPIDAETARAMGLVNKVAPAGKELDAAIKMAKVVASKSTRTVKIGKEAFYRQLEMPLSDAYRYTAEVMTENMMARDAEEGINAFIAKRPPIWEDR